MSASYYGAVNTRTRRKIQNSMATNQPSKPISYTCMLCNMPKDGEIVQCDKCDSLFQFLYMNFGQSIDELPWNCQACENIIPENFLCDAARNCISILRRIQLKL